MSDLRTPDRRVCELCGRLELYEDGGWRIERRGEKYCIHEWDIDGTFVPVETDDTAGGEGH